MPYFKNTENKLFWLDDSDNAEKWLPGCEQVTDAEAQAILEAQQTAPTNDEIDALRRAAYIAEADPLFFKAQRGEVEQQVWLDKVAEIKARYPKEQE